MSTQTVNHSIGLLYGDWLYYIKNIKFVTVFFFIMVCFELHSSNSIFTLSYVVLFYRSEQQ